MLLERRNVVISPTAVHLPHVYVVNSASWQSFYSRTLFDDYFDIRVQLIITLRRFVHQGLCVVRPPAIITILSPRLNKSATQITTTRFVHTPSTSCWCGISSPHE